MITDKQKQKYLAYLRSPEWHEIKIDLIQTRGLKCEKCSDEYEHPSKVQVHHKTYKRLFNESPNDLILLCAGCHMAEHDINPRTGKKVKKKATKKNNPHYHKKKKGPTQSREKKAKNRIDKLVSNLSDRDKDLNERYNRLK